MGLAENGTGGGLIARIGDALEDAVWRTGMRLQSRRGGEATLVPAESARDGKFLVGRNGRLFLANDSHRVVDQLAGRVTLSDKQLERWRSVLETRTQRLAESECAYAMLVVPNAHSVYPEDLPRGLSLASERPVNRLIGHLARTEAAARVVYPLDELLQEKGRTEVYPRTESHWNEAAAFAAYSAIAAALGDGVPMRVLEKDEIAVREIPGIGDLGIKRWWPRLSPHQFAYVRHSAARLVADNRIYGTGSVIISECPAAPEGTCIVFGDSYTFGLLSFLAESFGRLIFAQMPALDWTLVEREQPDAVLTVLSERFLIDVPDDDHAPPSDALAAAKFAEGRVRPWRMERWSAERHVAPVEVERIRVRMLAQGRHRDAAMVSTLAYAGLMSRDLHRLRWRHLKTDELRVVTPQKGHAGGPLPRRSVPLFEPLRRDLEEWRAVSESTSEQDLMFPSDSGETWERGEWRRWADERYAPIARDAGVVSTQPGHLRRTFGALRVHEGATVEQIAEEFGLTLEDARSAFADYVGRVGQAGHVSATAEIERARRLAAQTYGAANT